MSSAQFSLNLKRALAIDLPYPERPLSSGRAAGVLVLFAEMESGPSIVLTERTQSVETHKGQIAFPGGMLDPQDEKEQGLITTALRETEEEIGISRTQVEIIGSLPPLSTLTGFQMTPVLGIWKNPVPIEALSTNPDEITSVFWASLDLLRQPGVYRREYYELSSVIRYPIHVFQIGPHRVWGATGAVLKNLLDRMDHVG